MFIKQRQIFKFISLMHAEKSEYCNVSREACDPTFMNLILHAILFVISQMSFHHHEEL